ncbi:MAG: hypothetical protein JW808_02130 [Victivallales bacterium]|nr:hypothetical protein [Victivallales bacterium]
MGVGGTGMSALAQLMIHLGVDVSGSDRALGSPENEDIFSALRGQGVRLFDQDGSFASGGIPDVLVYSSAIEGGNPDFEVFPELERVHRADMLARSLSALVKETSVAVAGSCGKTSVTAWLAETLFLLGRRPLMVGGGMSKRFASEDHPGNFLWGDGEIAVFEADESDKSLLKFSPDYSVVLNMGTDHYPREELTELFADFISLAKKGAIVSQQVFNSLGEQRFRHLRTCVVTDDFTAASIRGECLSFKTLTGYRPCGGRPEIEMDGTFKCGIPQPGRHSAVNAAFVAAICEMLGEKMGSIIPALTGFQGVRRRFDFAGTNARGAKVYDDYAHNVEKIVSCIGTAREVASGKVLTIFQPHGFSPLRFMREPLFTALEECLGDDDVFAFLPVYYAGGTSSFSPRSEDVAAEYTRKGGREYLFFGDRQKAFSEMNSRSAEGDVVVIMGARDASLPAFAKKIACHN